MVAHAVERAGRRELVLPPGFTLLRPSGGVGAIEAACQAAPRDGAGTLVWAASERTIDLAVVLEPDEPLAEASRGFLVGMTALLDALGAIAPPDKALLVDWPDTITFDGARLGGGRLAWPRSSSPGDIPDWLVFSGTLIASKSWAGDPGLTPESTSLEEEGFSPEDYPDLVVSFARHLMRGFALWREEGLEAAAFGFTERLSGGLGGRRLEEAGLLAALGSPSWLDPATGAPRL